MDREDTVRVNAIAEVLRRRIVAVEANLASLPSPTVSVAAPVVNVGAPAVNVEAPAVNVEAPAVSVHVDMTPIAEALLEFAKMLGILVDAIRAMPAPIVQVAPASVTVKAPSIELPPQPEPTVVMQQPPAWTTLTLVDADGRKTTVTKK